MKNKILLFAFKCNTPIYYMITFRYFVLQPALPPPSPLPPSPLGDEQEVGLIHFSERLYRRDLGQIGILDGNWLFWSLTLTNMWQSVFVLLFSMVYIPPTNKYFFVCGAKFFLCVLQLGAGNISNFLGTFCIMNGVLISSLGGGARPFSSIKPSITNQLNSRTVDGKIICFMCAANFSHFQSGIFSLRIMCQFKCPLKLSRKCLLLLNNKSVKV